MYVFVFAFAFAFALSTLQPEDLQTRGLQQQPLLLGGTSKSIEHDGDDDDSDDDDSDDDDADSDDDDDVFLLECEGRSQ